MAKTIGFSDILHINKIIIKEPENAEEWLRCLAQIIHDNSCVYKNKSGKEDRAKREITNKKDLEKKGGL